MKLVAFSLEGYRRFADKTSVKLHGDLIAFVGPNEAGKSSLLKALAHLNTTEQFTVDERPRRTVLEPRLSWHFHLDDEDRDAIAHLRGGKAVQRAIVTKFEASSRWTLEPRPLRDRSQRRKATELVNKLQRDSTLAAADADEESEFTLNVLDEAAGVLSQDEETFSTQQVEALTRAATLLCAVWYPPFEAELDDDGEMHDAEQRHTRTSEAWQEKRDVVVEALRGVATAEAQRSPHSLAIDALKPRLPSIILFKEEDRELASEYDLNAVADSPPPALNHLSSLAELDLVALRDEAANQQMADVSTRRNRANRVLAEAFMKGWNQQGIAVQIEVDGSMLHVQATTPEDEGLSSIAERSDGMRWFAALLAYAHGWQGRPILLVDEIERHLHYDAQSDLIDVLARQSFTSKVLYTTHSFGCLPYDLGTGVRVVEPVDAARSRLENGVWKGGAGFSPLLASMGAAAVSFTPTRYALIAEGPSDAILLPTLLRQATGRGRLGFQIAPGLASVAAAAATGLDAEAGSVAFIVDGDPGGRAVRTKLLGAGISDNRIVVLRDADTPLEVEDLLSVDAYVEAVNDELRCWQPSAAEFTAQHAGGPFRGKQLESWCRRRKLDVPDKTAVAERIVNTSGERDIFDPVRVSALQRLLGVVEETLGLSPTLPD